jgi:hypothetical protein
VRIRLALGAALVGALAPVAAPPPVACAAGEPRAVLVVDTGADDHSYCVELPDGSVSGTELIELAHEQHGLTYKLGFGGGAVCMLAGIGPTGEDCFEDYPDFWGYWHGDGSGGWIWGSSGASGATVEDGDVEGWAWGSGDDPESHPAPPTTRFSSVCEAVRVEPEPKPDETPRAAPPSPSPPAGDDETADRPVEPKGKQRHAGKGGRHRDRDRGGDEARITATPPATPPPSPSPSPSPLRADATSSDGPPGAAVVGLVAALALGGAGALVARRRAGPG